MTRAEAKLEITRHPEVYLTRDKNSRNKSSNISYVCPLCGSGTGANGTGITSKDGVHFTCWAGCFTNSDIIDIIGIEHGLTGYNDRLRGACQEYGIDYDELEADPDFIASEDARINEGWKDRKSATTDGNKTIDWDDEISDDGDPAKKPQPTSTEPEIEKTNYYDFFKTCTSRLFDSDDLVNYLTKKRGISRDTASKFWLGYCDAWQSPTALKKGYKPIPTQRLIIPTSRYSYIARDIRDDEAIPENQKPYIKQKEGGSVLFFLKAFDNPGKPIIVVEGEIDTMSIFEAGHSEVTGLGSITNWRKFAEYVKQHRPKQPLLIALDNDPKGKETADKLLEELKANNIRAMKVDLYGKYKDANDRLVNDCSGLRKAIEEALEAVKNEDEAEIYKHITAGYCLDAFVNGITENIDTPYTPTGFPELDRTLDGGLYEGLYFIGAVSSLGKTTLALQIADNIACKGKDVLIFSLEMSRNELIAKSISRNTLGLAIEKGLPTNYAKTTRGITVKRLYSAYNDQELGLIQEAIETYQQYAGHIYIVEGVGDVGLKQIRETIQKHIAYTGNKPIVIIDYFQAIAPNDYRATDKQNTDKAVLEAKRISRDFKLTIMAISSFNRDSYNVEVSMKSYKESGSIEYGSDVLIGLQLQGVGESNFDINEAKRKDPRQVEAVILKNRNGRTGDTIPFDYYPAFNYFTEGKQKEAKPQKVTKGNKRETERKTLDDAFTATAKDINGTFMTSVRNLAEFLDIPRSATVRAMIREHGGYEIEKGTGIVTQKTIEILTDLDENPFADQTTTEAPDGVQDAQNASKP